MTGCLASLIADLRILTSAWNSVRGGWRAAWRDAVELLERRRVLIDTQAETRDGTRVVLRTRVRLSGDVQTDIRRCWMANTPRPSVEELARKHFQSVSDATRGWPASLAMIRMGTRLIVGLGAIPGIASVIMPALTEASSAASLGRQSLATGSVGQSVRTLRRIWPGDEARPASGALRRAPVDCAYGQRGRARCGRRLQRDLGRITAFWVRAIPR
jgi:hypothetical protein